MTRQRIMLLKRRLMESRFRISSEDYAFALPLYDMKYIATKSVFRISTNGNNIYFDPDWLQKLDDTALDFIISHQLMHIVLGHIDRPLYYKGEKYHLAADIVANSNLADLGWLYEKLPKIGNIYYETFFPRILGKELSSLEAFECVPFDPATVSEASRRRYMIDSDKWWARKTDTCEDGILILSPLDAIPDDLIAKSTKGGFHTFRKEFFSKNQMMVIWSDDSPTSSYRKSDEEADAEGYNNESVSEKIQELRDMLKSENSPQISFSERVWQANDPAKVNWRKMLNEIVQEDIVDYSFTPPDKRFGDFDIFLPDYNTVDKKPKEVLFLVDTSGSISDEVLLTVFSELKSAISQLCGSLSGILGFFDEFVYPLTPFNKITDLYTAKPKGGGGTNYYCVFDFIRKNFQPNSLSSIVIFTDGKADFPPAPSNDNIPVLWLFSNEVASAPWGRQAIIKD